jgi:hypothetical protein
MLKQILIRISILIRGAWAVIFPASYAKYVYKKTTGRKLNLKDPKDYNEKVQWLKVFSDTSEWTKLSDKYKVREYVEKCGLKEILVELYGVWERAEDIDFNKLPDKFVLKTNHGNGKNLLVSNKDQLNINETREQFSVWLKEKVSFEPHTWNIPRKIIAEEYLEDALSTEISSTLIDYKFWCINGEPIIVMVLYDREYLSLKELKKNKKLHMKASVFDLDWNLRTDIISGPLSEEESLPIPRPSSFDEMIRICKILSKPFIQVRVDLYEVNGKVYFGELTFTPGGGLSYFTPEYFLKLGEKMDLSKVKRRKGLFTI